MVKKQVVIVDGEGVVTPTSTNPGVPTPYSHQKVTGACLACKKAHHACDQARPKCARCVRLGSECEYRVHKKPGRKRLHSQTDTSSSPPAPSPQKRTKFYTQDNAAHNSPTTSPHTTTPEHTAVPPRSMSTPVDERQQVPIPFGQGSNSAPELLVTMLRAQQQQQHNQHYQQQQSWNHLLQEQRLQFNNARLQHEQFGVQPQQRQPPPLLNALLMCLGGSREKPQEEGRRQLGSLLNMEDNLLKCKQGVVPGDGEEKSDERFPGPSLGEGGLFSTGPVQNLSPNDICSPIDSSVYIPKYNPTRSNSTTDFRKAGDPSKLQQQQQLQYPPQQKLQFAQQFPSPPQDAALPNNGASTSPPLYVLPPPSVLSEPATQHSPPPTTTPFLASFPSPPYLDTPQPVVTSSVGDAEQLPSLSKLLNYCTKTR